MTKMTINGVSTTTRLGQEQYEKFYMTIRGKRVANYQYDYRDVDGELFTCVRRTLEECRSARDKWIEAKSV